MPYFKRPGGTIAGAMLFALCFFASTVAAATAEQTVEGVVTYVNPAAQTITIMKDGSRARRTYFVTPGTRLSVAGSTINLSEIKRGNTVALRYRATDLGREIVAMELPETDERGTILPVESNQVQTLEGTISGVRSSKRTITIRERETRERRTLKVPESVRIVHQGEEIRLNRLSAGDEISVRYRVTDRGLMLVTGNTDASAAAVDTDEDEYVATLPKTAGSGFLWLIAAMLAGLGAFAIRAARQRQA